MKVLTNDTIACTCINKKWVSCIEFYCLILSVVCVFCLSLSIYNLKIFCLYWMLSLDIRLENSFFCGQHPNNSSAGGVWLYCVLMTAWVHTQAHAFARSLPSWHNCVWFCTLLCKTSNLSTVIRLNYVFEAFFSYFHTDLWTSFFYINNDGQNQAFMLIILILPQSTCNSACFSYIYILYDFFLYVVVCSAEIATT